MEEPLVQQGAFAGPLWFVLQVILMSFPHTHPTREQ